MGIPLPKSVMSNHCITAKREISSKQALILTVEKPKVNFMTELHKNGL